MPPTTAFSSTDAKSICTYPSSPRQSMAVQREQLGIAKTLSAADTTQTRGHRRDHESSGKHAHIDPTHLFTRKETLTPSTGIEGTLLPEKIDCKSFVNFWSILCQYFVFTIVLRRATSYVSFAPCPSGLTPARDLKGTCILGCKIKNGNSCQPSVSPSLQD